ncbi:MAG: type II secretion system ATPase GspE [Planctomycetota bacterium]
MDQMLANQLLAEKRISPEKIEETLNSARDLGESWDQALVKKGLLTEQEMLQFFSRQLGLPLHPLLGEFKVPPVFVDRVDVAFARNYNLVALGIQDGQLVVATCRPLELHPIDELAGMVGMPVETVLAPRVEINSLINKAYQSKQDVLEDTIEGLKGTDFEDMFSGGDIEETEDILDMANKAPIIKLVNQILFQALKLRASDIHIQPFEYKLQVRYRIDGILHDQMAPPKKFQDAIVSRVKVMGKMDIAERRLPQDGRASIKLGDSEVDIRISSVPTAFGERIVMRLLDKSARMYELDEIGLEKDNETLLNEYINFSHGIILLTGPTGSGKTTTLYAGLNRINSAEKNVITIEDPIEYQIHNVSQIEVNPKKGLTFATGLRSIVRQDPDIIMVGEIRDAETAQIAIQSALTGHLVFSTLHTNDAPSAVTRLVNMHVEPFLVASSVICVVAQRLLRLVCNNCRQPIEATDDQLKAFGLERLPDGKLRFALSNGDERIGTLSKGTGCHECFNTGYLDRTTIHEVMTITDSTKDLIMDNASAANIKADAVRRGMLTLRADATRKTLRGLTTLEEVARVTQRDIV